MLKPCDVAEGKVMVHLLELGLLVHSNRVMLQRER